MTSRSEESLVVCSQKCIFIPCLFIPICLRICSDAIRPMCLPRCPLLMIGAPAALFCQDARLVLHKVLHDCCSSQLLGTPSLAASLRPFAIHFRKYTIAPAPYQVPQQWPWTGRISPRRPLAVLSASVREAACGLSACVCVHDACVLLICSCVCVCVCVCMCVCVCVWPLSAGLPGRHLNMPVKKDIRPPLILSLTEGYGCGDPLLWLAALAVIFVFVFIWWSAW